MAKLTRRQEEFIRNLLDLYKEQKGAIHYSELADRLGVNRFTAYDMLRVLQEKGFVSSDYQLAEEKTGPGRATVVFLPTEYAHQWMTELTTGVDGADWESVKDQILKNIRDGEIKDADPELALAMFARLPAELPPKDENISYCVEVMTIIALRLSESARHNLLVDYFPEIFPEDDKRNYPGLSLLGGFALGVLANDREDEEWNRELFVHVKQYQQRLMNMDKEQRLKLISYLRDVFDPIINQKSNKET